MAYAHERTLPTASLSPLSPLSDVPRAEWVTGEVDNDPGEEGVLSCPSTSQAWLITGSIFHKRSEARIVLAAPLDIIADNDDILADGERAHRYRRKACPPVAIKILRRRLAAPGSGFDDPRCELQAMRHLSSPGHPCVAPLLGWVCS
jgi:hypothetical protein